MAIKSIVCLDTDADRVASDRGSTKTMLGGLGEQLSFGEPAREMPANVSGRRACFQYNFTATQLANIDPLMSSAGLPPSKYSILDVLPADWRWNNI